MYADPPDDEVGRDAATGVAWLPHTSYDPADPPDVFVAWRYHISAALALPALAGGGGADASGGGAGGGARVRRPRRVFVWLQDVPQTATYTAPFVRALDGVFCLSA